MMLSWPQTQNWHRFSRHLLATFLVAVFSIPYLAAAEIIEYQFNAAQPVHAPSSDTVDGNLIYQYTYDPNGNLKTVSGTNGTTTFEYTAFNKLKRVVKNGSPIAQYRYGPGGTRIAKLDGSGNVTERYFGSIEKTQSGDTKYYFLGGKRIAKRTDNGALYFMHQDHLGSASVTTDDVGNVAMNRSYYEFGAIKSETGLDSDPHAYNDKRLNPETNFFDYDARAYAAKSFRFAQPDTIIPDSTNPQSFNRYAYVRNNPLKYIDPTGHSDTPFHGQSGVVQSGNATLEWVRLKEDGHVAYFDPMPVIDPRSTSQVSTKEKMWSKMNQTSREVHMYVGPSANFENADAEFRNERGNLFMAQFRSHGSPGSVALVDGDLFATDVADMREGLGKVPIIASASCYTMCPSTWSGDFRAIANQYVGFIGFAFGPTSESLVNASITEALETGKSYPLADPSITSGMGQGAIIAMTLFQIFAGHTRPDQEVPYANRVANALALTTGLTIEYIDHSLNDRAGFELYRKLNPIKPKKDMTDFAPTGPM